MTDAEKIAQREQKIVEPAAHCYREERGCGRRPTQTERTGYSRQSGSWDALFIPDGRRNTEHSCISRFLGLATDL